MILNKPETGLELPVIIESNDSYIFNGQVYDKNTLNIDHLNYLGVNAKGDTLSLNRRGGVITTGVSTHQRRTRGDMIVEDNKDNRISYLFVDDSTIGGITSTSKIVKVQKDNYSTKKIYNTTFNIGVTPAGAAINDYTDQVSFTFSEILGQTDRYIIYTVAVGARNTYSSTAYRLNQHFVYRLDKETGASYPIVGTTVGRGSPNNGLTAIGTSAKKLYENDQYIYYSFYNPMLNRNSIYGLTTVAMGYMAIYRYDKNAETNTVIASKLIDASESNSSGSNFASEGFVKDDELYFYLLHDWNNPTMKLFKLNLTNNSFTDNNVKIAFNDKIKELPKRLTSGADQHLSLELTLREMEGKKYINMFGFSTTKTAYHSNYSKILTFLVDEDNSFDLIAQDYCEPFPGVMINNIVDCEDGKTILVSNTESVSVLRMNTLTRRYEILSSINISHNSYGMDRKGELWIADTFNFVRSYSLKTPSKVDIKFENPNLVYNGEEHIDSNLIVNVSNYIGEKISVDMDLTIKGPAVFENDSKETRVTLSIENENIIPIKIMDSGNVNVYPKIIL